MRRALASIAALALLLSSVGATLAGEPGGSPAPAPIVEPGPSAEPVPSVDPTPSIDPAPTPSTTPDDPTPESSATAAAPVVPAANPPTRLTAGSSS
jgi:hypothetical protein